MSLKTVSFWRHPSESWSRLRSRERGNVDEMKVWLGKGKVKPLHEAKDEGLVCLAGFLTDVVKALHEDFIKVRGRDIKGLGEADSQGLKLVPLSVQLSLQHHIDRFDLFLVRLEPVFLKDNHTVRGRKGVERDEVCVASPEERASNLMAIRRLSSLNSLLSDIHCCSLIMVVARNLKLSRKMR